MSIDTRKLRDSLADPLVMAMDDATAAAALSVPILTPRTGITLKTLTAIDVLGVSKTATLKKALEGAVETANAPGADVPTQTAGAEVALVLSMLAGPGFDATDPQAQTLAPMFVALSGGAITDADAAIVLNTISYRCGGVISTQDVAAARAAIALDASYVASAQVAVDSYNGVRAWLDAKKAAGEAAPSGADVLAKMGNPA
jgi:hypothetical protein